MRLTWDGCRRAPRHVLRRARPVARRAETLRIGIFGAVLAYLLFDAARETRRPLVAVPMGARRRQRRRPSHSFAPSRHESSCLPLRRGPLGGLDLLTDFSILRYLRRTGAVSDTEYEAKKADLLHRA